MSKKLLIIDFDTPIVRCASMCQTSYVAINKITGEEYPVQSQKAFLEKIDPKFHDKFRFEWKPQPLKPAADKTADKTVMEHPEYLGMHALNKEIENMIALTSYWAYDVKFVIHKEGNHRNDIATIAEYKGNRKEKPIFTPQIKEHAIKKLGDKVVLAVGRESDDIIAEYLYNEYKRVGDRKEHFNVVAGGIDFDLLQCVGWHYNYNKNTLQWIDKTIAARNFWEPVLSGDASDNIKGIVDVPDQVREEFNLGKRKGIGDKTAEKLLSDCGSPKEMLERIVYLYRAQYPNNWFDVLEENCKLLYLSRFEGDIFCLSSRLEMFGIDF